MNTAKNSDVGFIAIGANIPFDNTPPDETICHVITHLKEKFSHLSASRIFRTPCFPSGSGPDYVNAVVKIYETGNSEDLLQKLHHIEHNFGRVRKGRWASRSLDLDLIAHRTHIIPSRDVFMRWHDLPIERQMQDSPKELILPHPRMQDRAFVLGPMLDIAPDWKHPVLGRTTQQLWDSLPAHDRSAIQPI